jgi:hypothetical protein
MDSACQALQSVNSLLFSPRNQLIDGSADAY